MSHNYSGKFQLPNGKFVYIQTDDMVTFGQDLTQQLYQIWNKPKFFYHLRSGGHVKALKKHLGSKYFATIDLSNFFGHVTRNKIIASLKKLRFSYDDAMNIAVASTVRDPKSSKMVLPFGFTQSPILASIVLSHSKLGRCLEKLKNSGVKVSLYVDDIILSSTEKNQVASAYTQLLDSAKQAGFSVNTEKSQSTAQKIKVFNITLGEKELSLTPERLEQFLTDLFMSKNYFQIQGILNYAGTINDEQRDWLEKKKKGGVF